jgi:DNA-binding HxlR family transcriptional regulator
MKNPIKHINRTFESRMRLGIMSVLMVNRSSDFISLKEQLHATDGNLASHLKALEERGMISVSKQFIGRKPNTSYQVTKKGRDAFTEHLNALEKLIRSSQ